MHAMMDEFVVSMYADHVRAAHEQQPNPQDVAQITAKKDRLDQRIAFILRNPGDSADDERESQATLRELRRQRAEIQAQLAAWRRASERRVEIPTEAEVQRVLDDLGTLLTKAAIHVDPAVAGRVRELIERLTGGCINLSQAGDPAAHRGWLQGRFRLRLLTTVVGGILETGIGADGDDDPEVVIDYRLADRAEELADAVKELYDQGLLIKEIARRLRINRNLVTKALNCWFAAHAQAKVDGRARRSTLADKHLQAPFYRAIADDVKRLADEGLLFADIAERLQCDINTVTAGWRYWHESRGQPVPDGRERRKTLVRKTRPGSGS
jgi:hypothetical protein